MTKDDLEDFEIPWEFSEQELSKLDPSISSATPSGEGSGAGGPRLSISLESQSDVYEKEQVAGDAIQIPREFEPPYNTYRAHRGFLSVSDLVGLVWCEVQFDYGLKQGKPLPVAKRLTSFLTDKGKIIKVNTELAVSNDLTMKAGTKVHNKLEREDHKLKVYLATTNEEEEWAVKLLDIITRLSVLKIAGRCVSDQRELIIFGFLNDQAVVGCIDEVLCQPYIQTKKRRRKTEKNTGAGSTGQTTLQFTQIRPQRSAGRSDAYTLHVVDTKTRNSRTLPSDATTFGPRMQLMMYWRLLDDMISTEHPLNLRLFFERLYLDISLPFSQEFLADFGNYVSENGLPPAFGSVNSLEMLIEPFHQVVSELFSSSWLSPQVKIVYRRREGHNAIIKGDTVNISSVISEPSKDSNSQEPSSVISTAEEVAIATSNVTEKARGFPRRHKSTESTLSEQALEIGSDNENNTDSSNNKLGGSMLIFHFLENRAHRRNIAVENPIVDLLKSLSSEDIILGEKIFSYDELQLNNWLERTLAWWYGKRAPEGVSEEDTRKCMRCEYMADCEWREEQAAAWDQRIAEQKLQQSQVRNRGVF